MRASWAIALAMLVSGCAVQTGAYKDFSPDKKTASFPFTLGEGRVWIRSFGHREIGGVSSVYVSGYGGSASGIAVSRQAVREPPEYLVTMIQESGIFKSATPIDVGSPDFIMEGSISGGYTERWWTWAQLVDLWIHAWFFPTLGRDLKNTVEFRLYNSNYELLRSWTVHYEKDYVGDVWWMMSHGGAYDVGTDVAAQSEVVKYAMDQIKEDLIRITHEPAGPNDQTLNGPVHKRATPND